MIDTEAAMRAMYAHVESPSDKDVGRMIYCDEYSDLYDEHNDTEPFLAYMKNGVCYSKTTRSEILFNYIAKRDNL